MSNWRRIYEKEINDAGGVNEYFRNKISSYDELIKRILKYAPQHGKILESGSGTGLISIYLSNLGYQVTAVDINKDMLDLSASIAGKFPQKPKFINENIFRLSFPEDYFDVAFSSGVFEHFNDDEIINITDLLLKISKTLIISVPSDYYKPEDRMHGDERFLSQKYWLKLFEKTNGKVIEILNYSFRNWFEHLAHILKMKPSPYMAFIIKKR